ncbi:Predicted CoA-binding protein [Geoalkalibacter ferrihydriticus]|uniref:CoA-binding protein n=2 Tax=Geoalkalibacter ferrihydriticus TaxID=392333 RepID=A0A0C2DU51_9BACT|nr:CoA-binding protein [Geoalkalibacter ferrihydriticus]KIH76974.1 CoA-binding protein [Geoalkalibacter ferrihydriticus DSM 17813]SDL41513.1 Predicted CoA-binding protein [Geoalkalibacter ferrihydriticus]
MKTISQKIDQFLAADVFGVVGASSKTYKYGNKVLRCYLQNGRNVIPVNPVEKQIEGIDCVANVSELPDEVKSISVITPPQVTDKVVDAAIARGVENIWMQPGAESPPAVAKAEKAGLNVIADGSCILVVLGFSGH